MVVHSRAAIDSDHGWSPLHYTAYNGSPSVARVLIHAGAELNQMDDMGFTPLFTATRSRESESEQVARMLIKAGAAIDLNTAVCLGDIHRVRTILAADPAAVHHAAFPDDLIYDAIVAIDSRLAEEAPVWQDWSPEKAMRVLSKYRLLLDILIEHGADVDGVGFGGCTPLFIAIQLDHPLIAEILLQHGADVNYRTKDGLDVWTVARNPCSTKEARLLLERYGFEG